MDYLLYNIDMLPGIIGYVLIIYSVVMIISAYKAFYTNRMFIEKYEEIKTFHFNDDYYIDRDLNYNRVMSALICIIGIIVTSIAILKYPIFNIPVVDNGIALFMKMSIWGVTFYIDRNEIEIIKGIVYISLIICCPFLFTGVCQLFK